MSMTTVEIPKVSVIIPCYNQACFLPETLDSVLAQIYENWECVIVDDGSPEDAEDVAKNIRQLTKGLNVFFSKIKVW